MLTQVKAHSVTMRGGKRPDYWQVTGRNESGSEYEVLAVCYVNIFKPELAERNARIIAAALQSTAIA